MQGSPRTPPGPKGSNGSDNYPVSRCSVALSCTIFVRFIQMSYLVSARKFRPQTFGSIVGQDHVSIPLANAVARGRIPHALLLTGPRGVGKTSCARVFAKAVNCTGRKIDLDALKEASSKEAREAVEPCGECTNCDEIARSCSIAVREIDGASNNSVDNVRELIESLRSLPPPGSEYKIYIIDEVHMLSTAAFNALLKSLEEPPPNTIFVFATTEPHKIPETVISRCQRYDFRALTPEAIAEQLSHIAESEGLDVSDEVLRLISRKAQGGMRDAQSMFDRLLAFAGGSIDLLEAQRLFGVVDRDFFLRLSEAVFGKSVELCFELIDEVFAHSIDIRAFAGDFLAHWRDMMLLVYAKSEGSTAMSSTAKMVSLNESELERAKAQISDCSAFDAQRLFDIAESTVRTALSSTFPRYVLEAGVAKMASLQDLRPVPELIDRLERLEAGGAPAAAAAARPAKAASVTAAAPAKAAEPTPEPRRAYNPSWRDFVAHVQGRGEPVLCAHLRRVSPVAFSDGELALSAAAFDKDALERGDLFDKLRRCLHSYSGNETWTVRFEEATSQNSAAAPSTSMPMKKTNGAVHGSLAEQERRAEASKRAKIDREARNDPTVKSVLSAFSGSKVEKVSPLK